MIFNYESVVESSGEPSERYRSNEYMSISERARLVQLGKEDLEICKRILNIRHMNILSILDVTDAGEVVYWQPKDGDFGSLDKFFDHPFFVNLALYPFEIGNLKLFMYNIMNGLVELHERDVYHGNLCIETVYFYLPKDSRRPIFKLGNFKYCRGDSMLAMLKDWRDMGSLLESLMDSICASWRTDYQFVEFRDLCMCLKDAMGVNTPDFKRYFGPALAEMSKQCRQFVIEHPGMLQVSDRPSYILAASGFVEAKEMGSLIMDDDFDEDHLGIDDSLVEALKIEGAISPNFENLPDGRKGEAFQSMVRNLLGHQPLEGILANEFGSTSMEIDDYFRKRQPNLVLILYRVVKGSTFKFESFVSLNPEAFLL